MANTTSGGALAAGSTGGSNAIAAGNSIVQTQVGVNPNSPLSPKAQQHNLVVAQQQSYNKGRRFSITVSYPHQSGGTAGDYVGFFRVFDYLNLALYNGAEDNATGVAISSQFGGGSATPTNNYLAARSYSGVGRMGSVGTIFTFGNSTYLDQVNLQLWNGNIAQYTALSLQDDLTLAQNIYANNQAQLIMRTSIWVNPFLAITGVLPDPGSGNPASTVSILFNICTHGNF